jgi:hypothetical protein
MQQVSKSQNAPLKEKKQVSKRMANRKCTYPWRLELNKGPLSIKRGPLAQKNGAKNFFSWCWNSVMDS